MWKVVNCGLDCLPGQAPTAAEVYFVLSSCWTRTSGSWLMSAPSHWMTSLGLPAWPCDIVQVLRASSLDAAGGRPLA